VITNQLNLGSIQIPINAATKTFAILAKRGAGKTWTAAVMAEELFKNGIPFVVFDPIDVWWGLRLTANGKDAGLPVVVFGLEHADIPLDRDMGRTIAQAIVRENVSCVINTFGMPKVAQRHLIAEFAEELLNINNTPRHVFIEEAHEFVPQHVFGGLGKTFNSVSNLVVMGRNRGIGVTLINQRAATINKDVLTQLDTLLAFQNVSPQDRKALKDWVEFHAAEGDFEKFMASLPSLPKGEGWIWSPEFLGIFERIKIRKRETFHPDREKIGDKFTMPEFGQTDIQAFIGRFARSLEDGKKKKGSPEKSPVAGVQEELKPKENPELLAFRNEYESKLMQKDIELRKLREMLEQVRRIVDGSGGNQSLSVPISVGNNVEEWLKKLGNGGASRIFKFLAEKSGMKFTKSQIALAVRLRISGSFNTYLSTLKRTNLIVKDGNFFSINPDL
jgi:hypothetical protein